MKGDQSPADAGKGAFLLMKDCAKNRNALDIGCCAGIPVYLSAGNGNGKLSQYIFVKTCAHAIVISCSVVVV
jgi:hypothetical protein